MTDLTVPAEASKQKDLAQKLHDIHVRKVSIASLEESIDEYILDLEAIYFELGQKKSKGEIKTIVDVYVDAKQAEDKENTNIDKAKLKLEKIEAIQEELSVLDRFRVDSVLGNAYDQADALVDGFVEQ